MPLNFQGLFWFRRGLNVTTGVWRQSVGQDVFSATPAAIIHGREKRCYRIPPFCGERAFDGDSVMGWGFREVFCV